MIFEALIKSHGAMLWRIALSREKNAARCEELYQEICVALWRSLAKVRGAENPRAFIARIANNVAISHVREETRRLSTSEMEGRADQGDVDVPDMASSLDSDRQKAWLLTAVQDLPLNWRLPVTLTLEGFKPAEIAFVMGESANTISLRLTRAKQRLKSLRLQADTDT